MKTATADYLTLQNGHRLKYYKDFILYRRQWNSGTEAYELAGGLDISPYVISAGKISIQLDLTLTEWKTSNLNIKVKNTSKEWDRDYPGNIFDGYIPEFSVVTITHGYIDSSDVKHGLVIYRGVITFDGISQNIDNKVATLHIRGYQDILDQFSAEDLADNQQTGSALAGAVNGVNKTFTTSDNGVGIIKAVYLDGVEYDVNDYTVSDLNDTDNPATIEMDTAPAAGSMTTDYVYWYQDKSFKYLLEKLTTHAGIASTEIEDVSFPSNIKNEWEQTLKSEFDAGTKEFVYTTSEYGQGKLHMGITYHHTSAGTFTTMSFPGGKKIAQSFKIHGSGFYTAVEIGIYCKYTNFNATITIEGDSGGAPDGTPIDSVIHISTYPYTEKYLVVSGFNAVLTAGTTFWLVINFATSGTGFGFFTNLDYPDGLLKELNGTWTDLGVGSLSFHVKSEGYGGQNKNVWMSQSFDMGTSVGSLGIIIANKILAGDFTYYTRTQAIDAGWPLSFSAGSWDEVGSGGIIQSTVRQYIKVAVIMNMEFTTGVIKPYVFPYCIPYLNWIKLSYYTTNFTINLADFTGLSVRGVVRELAIMANYEFGFKTDGTFFFKAKNTSGEADLTFYGVVKIKEYKIDWDRVKNHIIASFGDYTKTTSPITEGESSPHSIDKYGVRELSISGGNILNNEEFDIATGISEIYYDRQKDTKYRCRVTTKIFGQLDVSDLIDMRDNEDLEFSLTLWDNYKWPFFWSSKTFPWGMVFRILKITMDIQNYREGGMELELLEV